MGRRYLPQRQSAQHAIRHQLLHLDWAGGAHRRDAKSAQKSSSLDALASLGYEIAGRQ